MSSAQPQELKTQEVAFEALNLQVGVRLQFLTHRGSKPVPYFSTLVGYVKDEYIIVRIPSENGVPIGLTEGERITIRVFSGVNVCSFVCTVERVFNRPLLYVHLSFPSSIQGSSLRSAMRVKTDIAARAKNPGWPDAKPVDCTLVNISVTGARVDAPVRLPANDELIGLQFSLALPGAAQPWQVDTVARVCNVSVEKTATGNAEVHSHGVQFVNLDPVHFTLLQNMTYEALLADRAKIV
jgi:c-di-GMP-binding flagellar brake protein YcgR